MVQKRELLKEQLRLINFLIEIFDDLSVLRRHKPENIERTVEELGDKEVRLLWRKYRRDAEKIIYFPLTIPKVRTLIKLRMLFQFLMPLGLIYVIMVIGFIWHPKMFPPPLSYIINFNYMIAAIVVTTIAGFGIIFADFFARRTIIKKELESEKKLAVYQERMKEATQRLIYIAKRKLAKLKNVKMVLELYHEDYKDVKLVEERKIRSLIFPRKFKIYIYEL